MEKQFQVGFGHKTWQNLGGKHSGYLCAHLLLFNRADSEEVPFVPPVSGNNKFLIPLYDCLWNPPFLCVPTEIYRWYQVV